MKYVNSFSSVEQAVAARDVVSPNVSRIIGASNRDGIVYTNVGVDADIVFKSNNGFIYGMSTVPSNNEIWYTSVNDVIVDPQHLSFVSNTYTDGKGVITFENNVTALNDEEFFSDGNLVSINLPKSLTAVGSYSFQSCSSLASVSLPEVIYINGGAFQSCSSLASVELPQATTIEYSAFDSCSSLASVELPQATYISESAFYNCTSLTSVSLPKVTSIGESAFYNCTSLTSVSLPVVTTIGTSAFCFCSSLTSVSLPKATYINYCAFYQCTSLTSVSLPLVTTIDESAFDYCSSLTSIDLGSNITSIGSNTFSNINSFKLTVRATTAPALNADLSNASAIYVPSESVDAYKNATNWSTYASKIQAIS